MVFVCMLALQLTGALILLLKFAKGNKSTVIKNCFPGSNFAIRDDDDNCEIPKEKLQNSAHDLYLNIAAFGDLVAGYLIAAFSPITTFATICTVLGVIGVTVVLLTAEYYLSLLIAKKIYSQDMIISYSELEKYDVDTNITSKEIEEQFYKIFEE